jgi:hypothetical protein
MTDGHRLQTSRLVHLPLHVLLNLFSYLDVKHIGRLAQVCRVFYAIAPTAIYFQLRMRQGPKIEIQQMQVRTYVALCLEPIAFDKRNAVVTFHCVRAEKRTKPRESEPSTPCTIVEPYLPLHCMYRLFVSGWERPVLLEETPRSPHQAANAASIIFHQTFHPYLTTSYRCEPGVVGDDHVIACWASHPVNPSLVRLDRLYVSLPYLLGGLCHPPPTLPPMYQTRLEQFQHYWSSIHGHTSFDRYDSHLLDWLIHQQPLHTIIGQVSTQPSRRQQIEEGLRARGLHPHIMWKYSFVQRFVTNTPPSQDAVSDIIRRICEAEASLQPTTNTPTNTWTRLIKGVFGSESSS